MKIVFLDEYSVAGRDMSSVAKYGDYTGYDFTLPEQVIERCREAEIVISNKVMLSADTMSQLPNLRLICVAATGMNNVDLNAAAESGIEVRNAVGYSTYSVAETTLCSALSLMREVVYYDDFFHSGKYSALDRPFNYDRPTSQIRGKKWGIIGLGNIGREVARLATAFGCEVSYTSTSGIVREEEYPAVSLEQLLSQSDIISIHSPLNAQTLNLVDREELAKMKPSSILINVARGGIVNETALAEALNAGTIRAAALDVFSVEPLRESPLFNIKDRYRLLASPHNAWSSDDAIDRLIGCIAKNIENYISQH